MMETAKKQFEEAEIETIRFENDLIATSGGCGTDGCDADNVPDE